MTYSEFYAAKAALEHIANEISALYEAKVEEAPWRGVEPQDQKVPYSVTLHYADLLTVVLDKLKLVG